MENLWIWLKRPRIVLNKIKSLCPSSGQCWWKYFVFTWIGFYQVDILLHVVWNVYPNMRTSLIISKLMNTCWINLALGTSSQDGDRLFLKNAIFLLTHPICFSERVQTVLPGTSWNIACLLLISMFSNMTLHTNVNWPDSAIQKYMLRCM